MTKMHKVFMTPYPKKNTAIQGVPLPSLPPTKNPQNMIVTKIARLPLVTDWWCPECNETALPQALSACTHYGHVVSINHFERIWFEKICSREYDQVFLFAGWVITLSRTTSGQRDITQASNR